MEFTRRSWIIFLILCIAERSMSLLIQFDTKGSADQLDAFKAVVNSNQSTPPSLIPCENGWFLFNDMCYKLFDERKGLAWKEAEASCSVHHGSLVSIHNNELQDFLTTFLLLSAKSDVWIGLHDRERESQFLWDDGSVVNYTNWHPGEPTGFNNHAEDCVEMIYFSPRIIGKWNDIGCDVVKPYICQSNKNEQSLNHDPRFCTHENDGAWNYLNSCYHTVDEEMTWDDAENYCQAVLKGHLLSILNAKTDMFLNYILSNFKKEYWIGIKIREGADLIWTSGWPVKFTIEKLETNWDSYEEVTCAFMTKENFWSSMSCFQKLPFICEVPKDNPPALKQAPEGWRCPELSENWIDLGGEACYIFETRKPKAWQAANSDCSKKGGYLASIDSVAKTNAIHRRIMGMSDSLFIGLHRSSSNNDVFEWADGTKLDYENWKIGEPNNKNEGCGEVSTEDMIWDEIPCEISKRYICSAKKIPPAESNRSTFKDSQHLVHSNSSGNVSSSTLLAVLLAAVASLLVAGFTIYSYKDNCRQSFNQRWKYFAQLTSRNRARSSEFTEDESYFRI